VCSVYAEDKPKGWTDTAEFSFVATDGNAESTSLGFKNTLGRTWERSGVIFRVGGIRVKTTTFARTAVDGVVTETETTETTSENYFANGRYDRRITDRLFWFAGGGWDRNRPAGIENRYVGEGGVGNIWFDSDDRKFKTTYGVTYTDQEDVARDPTIDETFLGARFAWEYLNKLGQNTTYTNDLTVDENLGETSDWRADMYNGLAVAMNERLALKVGLRLQYDNLPAIDLVANTGVGPAQVPYELEELDTIVTISLVVDFP
jgi:putative salt-induced outer membrane protein YdiY